MALHPREFLPNLNNSTEQCINYYHDYINQVSRKIDNAYPDIDLAEKQEKIRDITMIIDYSVIRGDINLIKYFHETKGHKIAPSWFHYWCNCSINNPKKIFDYCNEKVNCKEYFQHFEETKHTRFKQDFTELIHKLTKDKEKKEYILKIKNTLDKNSFVFKLFDDLSKDIT